MKENLKVNILWLLLLLLGYGVIDVLVSSRSTQSYSMFRFYNKSELILFWLLVLT